MSQACTIETGNRWLDERGAKDRGVEPGQYVSMCVSDTGTGMTQDVIARALDPFFTTKPTGQGTGLGLSMVYGFAGRSGGAARIYSEPGKGTMICLYLPRHIADGMEEEVAPMEPPTPMASGQTTVPVVDDEPLVRMVAVEILDELGYSVLEAEDAPSALKILKARPDIDVLVTDVGLPNGMNGRQMADAVRADRPGLKPFAGDVFARRIAELVGSERSGR